MAGSNDTRPHWFGAAVAALWVIGLVLRVWGADWSLPYADHPDEPAVANVILRITQGQLDPDFFFYPSLPLYLQALVFKAHFWWGLHSGVYDAPLVLPATTDVYTTVPGAFLWGRLLTGALGAATVPVLAIMGTRYVGQRAALTGAALLLVSPYAIMHSHYLTVDIPAAFFTTIALLAAGRVLDRGATRDYVLAGTLGGLAAAMKYQSVLVLVALLPAHLGNQRGNQAAKVFRLLLAGLAATVVFLATSPYILLNWEGFRRDIETLVASYQQTHGDVVGAWPVGAYLEFLWREGLRPLPALLCLFGVIELGRRRPSVAGLLLAFPALLIVLLLRPETHFFRNLLPIQPILLLVAGFGAVALWDRLRGYLPSKQCAPVATLSLLGVMLPSLIPAVAHDLKLAQPDSRVVAQQMIHANWPGARVASELTHPLLWQGLSQSTNIHYLPLQSSDWYRRQGYGLLLATSGTRRSLEWTPDYEPLLAGGRVILTAGGPGSRERGPRIDIIDIGLAVPTYQEQTPLARFGPLALYGATIGHLTEQRNGPEVIETRQFKAGDILSTTTFWTRAETVQPAQYMLFLHLRDLDARNLTQRDAPLWNGLFPPWTWRPGLPAVDRLDLLIPPNMAPGQYRLVLGLYDGANLQRFPAWSGTTRLPGDELDLGVIEIVP